MQHAIADKRVYCHETLHYQKKMQTASYKAQVAAWDDPTCSSDSDDSDDEEDDFAMAKRLMR